MSWWKEGAEASNLEDGKWKWHKLVKGSDFCSHLTSLTWRRRLETQNPVAINSILVARCSQRSVNHTHKHTHMFPLWQEVPGWAGERVNIWGKRAINREHCSHGWLASADTGERETGKAALHKFTAPWTAPPQSHVRKHWLGFQRKLCFTLSAKSLQRSFENFTGGPNNDITFSPAFQGVIVCLRPAEWEACLHLSFGRIFILICLRPLSLLLSCSGWTCVYLYLGWRCYFVGQMGS